MNLTRFAAILLFIVAALAVWATNVAVEDALGLSFVGLAAFAASFWEKAP